RPRPRARTPRLSRATPAPAKPDTGPPSRAGLRRRALVRERGRSPMSTHIVSVAEPLKRDATTRARRENKRASFRLPVRFLGSPLSSALGQVGLARTGGHLECELPRPPSLPDTDPGTPGHLRVPRRVVQPASSALRPRVRVPDQLREEPTAELIAQAVNRPPKRGQSSCPKYSVP